MILHASGFVRDSRPTSVSMTTYEEPLVEVANGVIAKIRSQGHPVKVETIRSLSGWLKEVHAYVDVNGTEMWHVFAEPRERWPFAEPNEAAPE